MRMASPNWPAPLRRRRRRRRASQHQAWLAAAANDSIIGSCR